MTTKLSLSTAKELKHLNKEQQIKSLTLKLEVKGLNHNQAHKTAIELVRQLQNNINNL
mgnify:CR=1 FL=1